jgi:RNA-splicing ligase RtcB
LIKAGSSNGGRECVARDDGGHYGAGEAIQDLHPGIGGGSGVAEEAPDAYEDGGAVVDAAAGLAKKVA